MIFQTGSKKAGILMSVGMASLAISLYLFACVHPATSLGKTWHDGIIGLFMGMALGLNMGSVILIHRRRTCSKA
jgi:hypothetical protein